MRFAVRWPGRRKAWTAASGAVAFVLTSGMVLSHPGPQPPPPVLSQHEVVSTPTTSSPSASATPSAGPVTITTTPPDANRGITVYATPLGDGTLSMTETVRFDSRQHQLSLSPPTVASAPAEFRHLVPTVSQIELTVDGRDMQIKSHTITAPLVVVLGAAGALRVDVRYLLDNVVAAGAAGTTALSALVAPLIDGSNDALTVSYVIGAQINSYGCPQLTTATARADCQALARTSTSPVGLISGLPSSTALLVIGLPPGATTPSPPSGSSPPPSGSSPPPSGSSTPPSSGSPSAPAPTTPPAPPPPPSATSTPSTPPPATDPPPPPPSDGATAPPTTAPVPPTTPAPEPTTTPTGPPVPTETATLPPPTGSPAGGNGAATPPAATPAAADPAAGGASGGSGAASQAGSPAKAAVQGVSRVPAVVPSSPTPAA